MSRLNKAGAMKKMAQAKQYTNGCMVSGSHNRSDSGGHFLTPYELGCQAWTNGTRFSSNWHPHKQQGWKAQRNRDIKFAEICPSAQDRVLARLQATS